jgi:hypothetical protein
MAKVNLTLEIENFLKEEIQGKESALLKLSQFEEMGT